MGGKKKKAAGDAAKGEKVFKNLCAVCHLLKVSISALFLRETTPDPLLEELSEDRSPLVRDSPTRKFSPLTSSK